jgi:hypothetical protein
MNRTYLAPFAIALLWSAGCQRQAPAVASLDVQPRSITLAYPQMTTARLTWTPQATAGGEAPSEPLVFVHLLDAKGGVLRTFDHSFPQHWTAEGTPVSYDVKLYQSALAPPLDAGRYRLSVGLYEHSGKRYALDGLGKPIGRNEYQAAEIVVPPQSAGPRFTFSAAWLPLEAGSDKQVLARRMLSDQPGEIRVDSIPGSGTVWLLFRIPPGDGATEKLVLHDPASNSPAAVVRATCGGVETGFSGPGFHEFEMPVDKVGADGSCRISLIPNFHIDWTDRPEPHSVALQVAAWVPRGVRGAADAAGAADAPLAATPGAARTPGAAPAPPPATGAPPAPPAPPASSAGGKPGTGTGR